MLRISDFSAVGCNSGVLSDSGLKSRKQNLFLCIMQKKGQVSLKFRTSLLKICSEISLKEPPNFKPTNPKVGTPD